MFEKFLADFDLGAFLHQFLYDKENPLLFNNGFFVYFFFLFMVLFYFLRNYPKARRYMFCFFSLYFFYKASGAFVLLVILSAIVDFVLSNAIYRTPDKRKKTILLVCSIVFNLGMLFYFKYTNFFITVSNEVFHTGFNPLNILLPVGISFIPSRTLVIHWMFTAESLNRQLNFQIIYYSFPSSRNW